MGLYWESWIYKWKNHGSYYDRLGFLVLDSYVWSFLSLNALFDSTICIEVWKRGFGLSLTLIVLISLCAVDLVFVLIAIIRYSRRAEGKSTLFTGGYFLDIVFSDTFMALHFPNARKTNLMRGVKSMNDVKTYLGNRKKEMKSLFTIKKK